jgi:hypothetical protein
VHNGGQRPVALYRLLLGARFDTLPTHVRELHDLIERAVWSGRADVERGRSLASQAIATLFSLPPQGKDQPLRVIFEPGKGQETWTRVFGAHQFRSVQFEKDGMLAERVRASCLLSALDASSDGLALSLQRVLILGVPLPRMLNPRVRTSESQRNGRYHFALEAHLPVGGLLVRYAGWLERAGTMSA